MPSGCSKRLPRMDIQYFQFGCRRHATCGRRQGMESTRSVRLSFSVRRKSRSCVGTRRISNRQAARHWPSLVREAKRSEPLFVCWRKQEHCHPPKTAPWLFSRKRHVLIAAQALGNLFILRPHFFVCTLQLRARARCTSSTRRHFMGHQQAHAGAQGRKVRANNSFRLNSLHGSA